MSNAIFSKPRYTRHRKWGDGSAAPATDPTNLDTLLTAQARTPFSANGYRTIEGFVLLGGGTTPTVTLQVLEYVEYKDGNDDDQTMLVDRGVSIGPLSDKDSFSFETPGSGRYLLRVHALTGTPTSMSVHLAGGHRVELH